MSPVHTFMPFLEKGNNCHDFLFASLEDKALLKGGLLLKDRICS